MKQTLAIILVLFSFLTSPAQIDFSLYMNKGAMVKSYDKLFHNFREYGSIECIQGNCKSGFGILETRANKFKVYVAGEFSGKKINGSATVFMVYDRDKERSYIGNPYAFSNLKKSLLDLQTTNAYTYYQKLAEHSHESFFGNFENNKLMDNGLYTFNGNWEELHNRAYPIPLKHMKHVQLVEKNTFKSYIPKDKNFTYRYKGDFKPDYGEVVPAYTFENRDHYIEIIPSWTNREILIRQHGIPNYFEVTHYDKNGFVKKETLVFENTYGTIGWEKEFVPEKPLKIALSSTFETFMQLDSLKQIGLLDKTPQPFKDGQFYGEMVEGKPKDYGVFINDYYHYEGFFDTLGIFHGYGFLTLRKPIYKYDYATRNMLKNKGIMMEGYALGVFEHGRIDNGALVYAYLPEISNLSNRGRYKKGVVRFMYSGMFSYTEDSTNNFIVEPEKIYITSSSLRALSNPLQQGAGRRFFGLSVDANDVLFGEQNLVERGNYIDGKLNGYGIQKKHDPRNASVRGMWEGDFVDGVITEESKKNQEAREYTEELARRDSVYDAAPFKPGAIISDGKSMYYVNELNLGGCLDICTFPIKRLYLNNWQKRQHYTDIHYPVKSAKFLAYPWFTQPIVIGYSCELEDFSATNYTICRQCNGFAEHEGIEKETGSHTYTTTRVEKYHDGDYYVGYRTVTEYETVPTTTYHKVTYPCEKCSGNGYYLKEGVAE